VGPKPDGTIPDEAAAILKRIGVWYRSVKEAFDGVVPASDLTKNRDVLLTRKGNTLYVHLYKDPLADAIKLPPFDVLPRKATLLNTGKELVCSTGLTPRDHLEQKSSLSVRGLPVNELSNTVLVAKLEFDKLPEAAAASAGDADDIKRR
jgi:alpha-L-fucosidase